MRQPAKAPNNVFRCAMFARPKHKQTDDSVHLLNFGGGRSKLRTMQRAQSSTYIYIYIYSQQKECVRGVYIKSPCNQIIALRESGGIVHPFLRSKGFSGGAHARIQYDLARNGRGGGARLRVVDYPFRDGWVILWFQICVLRVQVVWVTIGFGANI